MRNSIAARYGPRRSRISSKYASVPSLGKTHFGNWKTIAPSDGLLDSHGEAFELRTAALEPGQKVITIRIRDAAGNKDDTKVTAVIPGEEKEEAGEEGDETEEDDKDDEETDETEEDDEEEKDDAETE